MIQQEQFNKMGINDREQDKFTLNQDNEVAIRTTNSVLENQKWYFTSALALNTKYPTATLWDNAIVAWIIYIRDSIQRASTGIRINSAVNPDGTNIFSTIKRDNITATYTTYTTTYVLKLATVTQATYVFTYSDPTKDVLVSITKT